MIRNTLLVIVALVAGAALYRSCAPTVAPPPVEEHGLSTGRVQEVMRLVSMRVPATVFVAQGQVVPSSSLGDHIQELLAGPEKKQVILFLKGQLDFGIDFETPPGLTVTTDTERKIARIKVPSPHLLHIADQELEVAFVFGPVTPEDINAAKNKAILLMRREAETPKYSSAAQTACAKQLSILAAAFGYTAEIEWQDAPKPSRD